MISANNYELHLSIGSTRIYCAKTLPLHKSKEVDILSFMVLEKVKAHLMFINYYLTHQAST